MSNAPQQTGSGKQAVFALLGAVALGGLLILGTTSSSAPEAELIQEGSVPSVDSYSQEAEELEYEVATRGRYDQGQLLTFDAEVSQLLDEPSLGSANVLVTIDTGVEGEGASLKEAEAILVFPDTSDPGLNADEEVTVMARYIGSLEYQTPLGADKAVPAFQVDHTGA